MTALDSAGSVLVAFAIKSSLIVAGGALVVAIMRRASPASRHLVWTATLAGVLTLPLVQLIGPVWHVAMLPAAPPAAADGRENAPPFDRLISVPIGGLRHGTVRDATATTTSTPAAGAQAIPKPRAPSAPAPRSRPAGGGLMLVWLAGIAVMCMRYAAGTFGIRRIVRQSHRTQDARVVVRVQQLAEHLNVARPVIVRSATTDVIPVTWGVVYPTVLLPASATTWDDGRLDAVLLHELAHVTRLDALTQLIAQLAVTIAWFNPFVRFAARRAIVERERACDNLVLANGQRASRYADDLVALVRTLAAPRVSAFAALAMARQSELAGRVSAILDAGSNRRGASRGAATLAVAMCAATIGMGAVRPTERTQEVDLALLQGKWYVAGMATAGQSMVNAVSTGASLTLSGNTFATYSMGATYTGTFTLGNDGTNRTIDMLFTEGPEKGNIALAIYKLNGETWTLCIGMAGQPRPHEFSTHVGGGDVLESLSRYMNGIKPGIVIPIALPPFKVAPDTATEMARLRGEWSALSIVSSGSPLPDMYLQSALRTLKGNEMTVTVAGQVQVHVSISVNPNTNPKSLDYVQLDGPDKGRAMLGIYEFNGDTLRTCYAPAGKPRPAEFVTREGDGRTLSAWKRRKPEPEPSSPAGPVDASYRLAPLDVVGIIVTGKVELAYALSIANDGFIDIPNAGRVYLANLHLDMATQVITMKLRDAYPSAGAASGSPTRVFVTVARKRTSLPG